MKRKIILIAISFSIPVVFISSLMIYLVQGPIKREFVAEHSKEFSQKVDSIDYTLQQLETYISNWGETFKDDFFIDLSSTAESYQLIDEINKRLFFLENTSPLIKSTFISVGGNEPFYIDTGGTWPNTGEDSFPSLTELESERSFQWIRKATNEKVNLFFALNLGDSDNDSPIHLLVNIDLQNLSNMLTGIIENENDYYAYLMNGLPIVSSESLPEEIWQKIKHSTHSIELFSHNHMEKSMVSITKNRFNHEWAFYSVIPVSNLIQPIQFVSTILLYGSIILIIATIFFNYYLSKKQYEPIFQLIGEIFGENSLNQTSKNAIEYLKKQWLDLQEEKSFLIAQSNNHAIKAKKNLISRTIRGEFNYYSESELLIKLKSNGWNTIDQGFHMYSIQITEYIEADERQQERHEVTDFILHNIITDIAEQYFSDYTILNSIHNCSFLFVTSSDCNKISEKELIDDIFHHINRVVKRYVTICKSATYVKLKALPTLFDNLSYYRLFHEMKKENQILVLPEKQERKINIRTIYPSHYEERILNSFRNKNKDELQKNTSEFVVSVLKHSNIQIFILEAVKQLYNTLSFFLLENGIFHNEYISKNDLLSSIEDHFVSTQIENQLFQQFLGEVFDIYISRTNEGLQTEVMQLRDYLQLHYNDPNLSLEQSAAELNLDLSLLSREFKKYVGLNYIDFITELRIEQAKYLLINTDNRIHTIAEEIGYNSSYFNKLFKKKIGITPGKFREQNK